MLGFIRSIFFHAAILGDLIEFDDVISSISLFFAETVKRLNSNLPNEFWVKNDNTTSPVEKIHEILRKCYPLIQRLITSPPIVN